MEPVSQGNLGNGTMRFETHTTKRNILRITANDLIRIMNGEEGHRGIPKNARVTTLVPGGGDWSNMYLAIDDEQVIIIEWEADSHDCF